MSTHTACVYKHLRATCPVSADCHVTIVNVNISGINLRPLDRKEMHLHLETSFMILDRCNQLSDCLECVMYFLSMFKESLISWPILNLHNNTG